MVGTGLAALLATAWLIADLRPPDLAAQVYRAQLFEHLGFSIWDEHWYGGHFLPGYSLLFPPLAALVGLRLLAVLSVLASATLFERLTLPVYGRAARWGAASFALAAVADIWSGRLTFALGVALALGAALAFARRMSPLAVVLAACAAAASPVAGVLLALAGVTYALQRRSLRSLLELAAPGAAVIVTLALLFGEGGFEPYPVLSFAATALVVLMFLWALPASERMLRTGALVYLTACLLCLLVHSPIGSNIERYGVLLAGPLLLCALASAPQRRPAPVLALVLAVMAAWVLWGPVRETVAVAGNESTSAAYYAPVEHFLALHGGAAVRLEVPLTRSHWEAALLAPHVSLARGWEKQLDTRFDHVLLEPGLSAAVYEHWLDEQAVAYVALPDTPLDPSSAQEGRLIRRGLPYLHEVFASRHWRIYAVLSPTPLASGPGRLSSLGADSFTLRASSAGRFLVRVHFNRYWTFTSGSGCVGAAPGGWTSVQVGSPGRVTVAARFSLGRALGLQGSCRLPVSR